MGYPGPVAFFYSAISDNSSVHFYLYSWGKWGFPGRLTPNRHGRRASRAVGWFVNQEAGWMASTGQTSTQVPQSVHLAASITKCSSPCEMAPSGHSASQDPQLMHSSLITCAMSPSLECFEPMLNAKLYGKPPQESILLLIFYSEDVGFFSQSRRSEAWA